MSKGGGTTVLALRLAGLVGVSYLPRPVRDSNRESGKQNERAGDKGTGKVEAGTPKLTEPCEAISGKLERFFSGQVPAPDSCYESAQRPPTPKGAAALKLSSPSSPTQ